MNCLCPMLKVENLKNPVLIPEGWDWDITSVKFTYSWSCGCHKFNEII